MFCDLYLVRRFATIVGDFFLQHWIESKQKRRPPSIAAATTLNRQIDIIWPSIKCKKYLTLKKGKQYLPEVTQVGLLHVILCIIICVQHQIAIYIFSPRKKIRG